MDESERAAVAQALEGLLMIAKVAMPAYLYDQDIRVVSATKMLDQIKCSTMVPTPTWEVTRGIDRFMASTGAPRTRSEAVILMVRGWLTANGYLELPPEEQN